MFAKIRFTHVWIAALVLLVFPTAALAGGWTVVTLDQLPGQVIAGQPYPLGFTARQHGATPWLVEEIGIEAWQPETGQKLTFVALPDQTPGHYQVELLFPQEGRWEWGVRSGLHPQLQPMPALDVQRAAATTTGNIPAPEAARVGLTQILSGSALILLAAGALLMIRGQKSRPQFLAGLSLIVLCVVSAYAAFSFSTARAEAVLPAAQPMDTSAGQQLFLAKGCVVCHTNDRAIRQSEQYGVNAGPNLSAYSNDPDYLHQFLKDPRSVRTNSGMPELGLEREEIEALIVFLNASQ